MKTIKTILVDDEPRGLASLQKLLQINCSDVEVVASCTSAEEAKSKIELLKPELVFLDIAMPVKNGFDLLKEIKELRFEVIFVTAHNQFMIEAFHFSAIDYLLKPVDDDLLVDAVNRAKKRIAEKNGKKNIETFIYNMEQKKISSEYETLSSITERFPGSRAEYCIVCRIFRQLYEFLFYGSASCLYIKANA